MANHTTSKVHQPKMYIHTSIGPLIIPIRPMNCEGFGMRVCTGELSPYNLYTCSITGCALFDGYLPICLQDNEFN